MDCLTGCRGDKAAWSHLVPAQDIRAAVTGAGFGEVHWRELRDAAIAWGQKARATAKRVAESGGRPPLGPGLFLREDIPVMIGNHMKGLEEDRLGVIQAVFRRTAVR